MLLAAVVVAGTWLAARHLPHGEARADASPTADVRTQEIVSISIDTPQTRTSLERRLPISELRGVLTSKPGDLLDATKLDVDRRALQDRLAAHGYLAAQVAPASVTFGRNGAAYVVFD